MTTNVWDPGIPIEKRYTGDTLFTVISFVNGKVIISERPAKEVYGIKPDDYPIFEDGVSKESISINDLVREFLNESSHLGINDTDKVSELMAGLAEEEIKEAA